MRVAKICLHDEPAGLLKEIEYRKKYVFEYFPNYDGAVISVTMPKGKVYEFDKFPAFFEGLLPEGENLEELMRTLKIDRRDYFGQLIAIGQDTVGAATISKVEDE